MDLSLAVWGSHFGWHLCMWQVDLTPLLPHPLSPPPPSLSLLSLSIYLSISSLSLFKGDSVELVEYEGSAAGLIQSFTERFQDDAEQLEAKLLEMSKSDAPCWCWRGARLYPFFRLPEIPTGVRFFFFQSLKQRKIKQTLIQIVFRQHFWTDMNWNFILIVQVLTQSKP